MLTKSAKSLLEKKTSSRYVALEATSLLIRWLEHIKDVLDAIATEDNQDMCVYHGLHFAQVAFRTQQPGQQT